MVASVDGIGHDFDALVQIIPAVHVRDIGVDRDLAHYGVKVGKRPLLDSALAGRDRGVHVKLPGSVWPFEIFETGFSREDKQKETRPYDEGRVTKKE
jgi:hypothetical protein